MLAAQFMDNSLLVVIITEHAAFHVFVCCNDDHSINSQMDLIAFCSVFNEWLK